MNPGEFDPHWWWLSAALLLGIAELLAPGVFLIFLAAAAALTGVATLAFGLPLLFQFALFPLFALAALLIGRGWYARSDIATSDPLLNDRVARHIGDIVTVDTAIEHGRGRVRIGDTIWPARGADAAAGARVRIVGAEGNGVRVQPIEE